MELLTLDWIIRYIWIFTVIRVSQGFIWAKIWGGGTEGKNWTNSGGGVLPTT